MSNPHQYEFESTGLVSPARSAFSISPSDSEDLEKVPRAIFVGGSGNISVIMVDGTEVVFNNAQAGSFLPIRVSRIKSTNTTATNLIGVT
jgi:hypothetical protein